MSVIGSFGISKTALKMHSRSLEAISSNIANVNTEGHKAGEIRYNEMVTANYQTPKFHGVNGFYQQFVTAEGDLQATGNFMDLALSGRGMFITSSEAETQETTIELTDNGRMQLIQDTVEGSEGSEDSFEYYLGDMKGNYVLGWPYDSASESYTTGEDIASLQRILMDKSDMFYEATATDTLSIDANLSAEATDGTYAPNGDVITEPDNYNFYFDIYDGSGPSDPIDGSNDDVQSLTTSFTKLSGTNQWQLDYSVENGTLDQAPITVTFNADGSLARMEVNTSDDPDNPVYESIIDEDFNQALSVTWDTSPDTAQTINVNWSDLTQYGEIGSFVNNYTANGNVQGDLSTHRFDEDGVVYGVYDNGLSKPIAKLAVGDVIAMDSLTRLDATHFSLNDDTGDLRLYQIDATDRVSLTPEYYELSTSDINQEFTKMIVVQRAYSSAATTLRTADEMMQTVVQIK